MKGVNRRFGRVYNHEIQYAKNYIILPDGSLVINPSDEQYLVANQFLVIDEKPVREGFYYTPKDWIEDAEAKTATHIWEEHEVPAKVRTFSVEEIIYGLIQFGALKAVKDIAGDYWDLLTMRETVAENNEIIAEVYPQIKAKILELGILTEKQIEKVLKDAEV